MKKRLVALSLVFVMAVATFTGCAKQNYTKDAEAIKKFDKAAEKISEKNEGDYDKIAKKLEKEFEEFNVKTDEGKDIKDDYEAAIKFYKDMGKLMKEREDGDYDYSELMEKYEKLEEKFEKLSEDLEEHFEDFYDACEDAGIDDDLLDDIEDIMDEL